jgi:2-polyprenyl-3-methyl-5-hydroxy-6-metoxy-1,4-benzoquinol methylase
MSKISVIQRNKCRLCASVDLSKFIQFEALPFFDEVVTQELIGSEFSYPMEVFFCNSCASVQTQHDVNLNSYYHSYEYVASHSAFIQRYMGLLADQCEQRFGLRTGDKVIEVGAADGYMLSLLNERGVATLGFEAAENLSRMAEDIGVDMINTLFTKDSLDLIPEEFKTVQLFILLHTFDHLYDPSEFLEAVVSVLDPERGVFLIEVHDLEDIYSKREVALFGHEHATYLHFNSMSRLLERHGLRIVDFNFLPKDVCRGSSMLVAATPEGSVLETAEGLTSHARPELDRLATFTDFQFSVSSSFSRLRRYLEVGKSEGKRFAGYGGWGRGITTLAIAGLGPENLEFVVDANRNLSGCFTPVTNIPIVSPDFLTIDRADVVIVFNYAYLHEIVESNSEFIANGGVFISVQDILADD